jgi:hypothetical protein
MPWCEQCAKYLTPSSVRPDGTCPTCGREVEAPGREPAPRHDRGQAGDDERAPWHFKLLVVMTVVYLTWRFVQIFT